MKLKSGLLVLSLLLVGPLASAAETAGFVYKGAAEAPASVEDREIAGLFDRWNSALQTGDANKVVELYASNAVLQPTVSNKVRTSPAEIKEYFEHFLPMKPIGKINFREIRKLGENVSMDSGVYTFTLADKEGKTSQVQARYTFVYEKVKGEWKILNHHSSAMPEKQEKVVEK
ncbi:SgcJ/EcaC family oxidoreductase [Pseudomonas costantinii]|uniref:DUF4440 domain-containing protein n=1 Tax=Pseudomonas costantinii TaxID=168469 RepID=A0A1S2V331_9PSED|nr:SgcJ/EcaC family oxidoreductase [Pseudomonas costantinii]OIN53161.1 DUF4440 domain-containing protein [Pseudomonas costantinii]SED21104.1 conserved hypothetical protein [Pseudomonas costantinii]